MTDQDPTTTSLPLFSFPLASSLFSSPGRSSFPCVAVLFGSVLFLGSDSQRSLVGMEPMSTTSTYLSSRTSCSSESDLPSEANTWNEILNLACRYEMDQSLRAF